MERKGDNLKTFGDGDDRFFLKVYIALGNGQADPTLLLETDKSRGLHKVFHIGGFPVLIVNLIFLIN